MVKDFWDQDRDTRKWRNCKDVGHSDESPLKVLEIAITQELEHRSIHVSSLADQLKCGNNTEGNFNLK